MAEVIEEATQAAQSSEVGNLYLALEKATEQVQAEATASKLGWNVLQLEDQPESYTANAGPVMILADSSRIASVTAKWLEASDRIYVLGESAAAGAIINENQEKTVLFPTGNLSGALQALMGSTRDGIA
ncbi:MAG: hypothetical protein KJP13_06295 [Altererythrobacter sp.]|nr:hypothetical protein [Altererythrobacter sp.]